MNKAEELRAISNGVNLLKQTYTDCYRVAKLGESHLITNQPTDVARQMMVFLKDEGFTVYAKDDEFESKTRLTISW